MITKKRIIKQSIFIFVVLAFIIISSDYFNLPSNLGFDMSKINWNISNGILNNMIVIVLYITTYKVLDERTVEREKNKLEISILLLKNCYLECNTYIELLKQDIIENNIIPKIDFNSTEHKIIINLQSSPFCNESTIMDLVKDGQINKSQIEGYFKVKEEYMKYITMRITLFDAPEIFMPIKNELCVAINNEIKKLS